MTLTTTIEHNGNLYMTWNREVSNQCSIFEICRTIVRSIKQMKDFITDVKYKIFNRHQYTITYKDNYSKEDVKLTFTLA